MSEASHGGFELIAGVLGFIGALLGVSYSPPMSKKEMFAALGAGLVCGALCPLLIVQLYPALPPVASHALAFVFGVGGMFIVPGLLALWRGFAVDPWGFIDRIRGKK
jgi:hypothetical protein